MSATNPDVVRKAQYDELRRRRIGSKFVKVHTSWVSPRKHVCKRGTFAVRTLRALAGVFRAGERSYPDRAYHNAQIA